MAQYHAKKEKFPTLISIPLCSILNAIDNVHNMYDYINTRKQHEMASEYCLY